MGRFVFIANTAVSATVGEKLADIRERRQVRQADLARALGMSRQQLSNIEAGRREISLTDLRKTAAALRVDTVDLLPDEDAPHYPKPEERALLAELRATEDYDPQVILAAVRAVLEAFRQLRDTTDRPRDLSGDPRLTRKLASAWNSLSDEQRTRTLAMLDHAREFSHDR